MTKKMDNGRPSRTRPGQSIYDDFERVCKRNSLRALEVVIEVMNNDEAPFKERLMAAESVMNRAWGKPKQTIDANIDLVVGIADALQEAIERVKSVETNGQ